MVSVEVIATEDLGDRSYVAHDGSVAVVVDPQRDLDRVEEILDRLHLACVLVAETHIHNDYVTGGWELARRRGARYAVAADDRVGFDRLAVADGDELTAGSMTVRVLATPGHTDTHVAYAVSDGDGDPVVFTGGSLLYGSVGRTDLLGPDHTRQLTHAQYRSARRLVNSLPAATAVYPTHGFGSFCSSGAATGGDTSTLAGEAARNDALTEPDEDVFVDRLIANLSAYPAYYTHMAPLNRQGPRAPDMAAPKTLDAAVLRDRLQDGEWVIDLRTRTAYAAGHLAGTVEIELGPQFSTYVGWLAPWGFPLTLIGADPESVAAAQRQLVRIGIDDLAGAATGTPEELAAGQPLRSYPVAHWADLPSALRGTGPGGTDGNPGVVLLDVRRVEENAAGSIPAALNVPIHDLLARLDDIPPGTVWVHCASGLRAGIAASLLDRAGRDVVLIDNTFADAAPAGIPVI